MFGDHDDDDDHPSSARASSASTGDAKDASGWIALLTLGLIIGIWVTFKPIEEFGPISEEHCAQYRQALGELTAAVQEGREKPREGSSFMARQRVELCDEMWIGR